MNTAELLAQLRNLGVQLAADGDRLCYDAPTGVLTPNLREQLGEHRSEILEFLRNVQEVANSRRSHRLPIVVPAPQDRHVPFPLTDVQQAYWAGRNGFFELGNVATHIYQEYDDVGLDLEKLDSAWQRLIERHEMLRAIILPDGSQQILEKVPPYKIQVLDLRGRDANTVESELERVRQRMSHQMLATDRWPLFEIRASRLDERRVRLHFSFDGLILDGWSKNLLFREWFHLYQDPDAVLAPLALSFRDYVLAEVALRETELYERSREYWWRRLPDLPPAPDLPLAKEPSSIAAPQFVSRKATLDPEVWLRLKMQGSRVSLTSSGVVVAAFAEVLKAWSRRPQLTLNLTHFHRLPLHPQVNDIVGDFTSLILLEVSNSDCATFHDRAQRLQRQFWSDLDHRYVGGVRILRELAKQRESIPRAAMPVVFTSMLNLDGQESRESNWNLNTGYRISQTPQVLLDHVVFETGGALRLIWNVVEDVFPEGLLDEMFDAYCRLLGWLANEPDSWQCGWPDMAQRILPKQQRQMRSAINDTQRPIRSDLLHTLFRDQVGLRPHEPALVSPDRTLTYQQLDCLATRLGHRLQQLGARPNTLVAIVMEKGWEQVVAVLGTLMSGAAYLPIDPSYPSERLCHLLDHGEVTTVLTQTRVDADIQWPKGVFSVCVDSDDLEAGGDLPLAPVQRPEDLAYVIYTSGSTGFPKGVMIDHRGAVNTIADINCRFEIGPEDRVLAVSSLGFDLSVYDIFGTLAAGGTIVMPEASGTRDPAHWAELISDHHVTVWNSVPALMDLLVEYADSRPTLPLRSLRLVLLSGDWIPVRLPDRIRGRVEDVQVISLGGATEASIWSVIYPIGKVDPNWRSIPYGRPMVNQTLQVLDQDFEPRPVWVPGQLYIGGVGVAKGYWRDRDKTQDSFLIHPRTQERLYRTGDLARYLPDGNLEFLGREDFQVKIQGYRVELGEIESAMSEHNSVDAVVCAAKGDPRGEKRLVAYVVPREDEDGVPTTDEWRDFLKRKLPDYMIPAAYVTLEKLPLTRNGKVDRRALPDDAPAGRQTSATPSGQLATQISQIVATVLKIDRVDAEANLLNVGATSVDMIRIANRVESEMGFRPRINEFYRRPTVAALAEAYQQHARDNQPNVQTSLESIEVTPESMLSSFELLLDPEERRAFKNRQLGLRGDDAARESVQLFRTPPSDVFKRKYTDRRSHRKFSSTAIPLRRFSKFLECLRQISVAGKPKYLHGSAGGLYPVQTYLYVKPNRVENLDEGIYYYHPVDHRLVLLAAEVNVDRDIYDPLINAPIFDEAAFSIFLVAQMGAIVPMYGERSMHYVAIEAGLVSQLLEMEAPDHAIGLCQVGSLDFQRVRRCLTLDEDHVLVHSLLGGPIDNHQLEGWLPYEEGHQPTADDGADREEEVI